MIQNCIDGKVASVSDSGDLITDIPRDRCTEIDDLTSVRVTVGPHETIGIHGQDHSEPDGTLMAILGDSGFVEITITGMNISEMLGLSVGQPVQIHW